ncbi:ABC transporter ATP-binding protein [Rheinheimera sp.]|uniref:ABC transporter ATP-binding protein n=1 Tax=Rheinheimera sp. TaxID=1869214 RepID=UPI00307DA1C2
MLEIKGLCKTYPDGTAALQQLQLSAGTGMFGLLGPNGAGKSSLLRTIATLQQPDSGELWFDAMDLRQQPTELRRQLGYLPQQFGVYPHMSCRALLEHIAILKGVVNKACRQQQINQLLELTNLTAFAHKAVANFSGGMRQRFGIAQALLGDPALIILDEPTAGLDPEERQRLYNLLVGVSKNRLVLLSTHIVDDIEQLCSQVAILQAGRILVQGQTEALIQPLQGKVWLAYGDNTVLPASSLVLSSTYQRGVLLQRFYHQQPQPLFQSTVANLQDRYFLELLQHREAQQ